MIKINFRKLSTKALADLARQTITFAKDDGHKMTEGKELLKNLEAVYNNYSLTYNKKTYSGKGKSVAMLDKRRDVLYSQLRAFIKAYSEVPTLTHQKQAAELYECLKRYKFNITSLSYAEESAQLTQIIGEFSTADNLQRLKDLDLEKHFEELQAAQKEFQTAFAEQVKHNADLRALPSATESRASLEELLRGYYTFVSVMKTQTGWSSLYSELLELTKSAKANPKQDKKEETV